MQKGADLLILASNEREIGRDRERAREKRGEERETVKIQKRNTENFFSRLEKSLVNLMGPPTYFFVFLHKYAQLSKYRQNQTQTTSRQS